METYKIKAKLPQNGVHKARNLEEDNNLLILEVKQVILHWFFESRCCKNFCPGYRSKLSTHGIQNTVQYLIENNPTLKTSHNYFTIIWLLQTPMHCLGNIVITLKRDKVGTFFYTLQKVETW